MADARPPIYRETAVYAACSYCGSERKLNVFGDVATLRKPSLPTRCRRCRRQFTRASVEYLRESAQLWRDTPHDVRGPHVIIMVTRQQVGQLSDFRRGAKKDYSGV